jgi:predicted DNA-binding protein (UPF0251 family)
MSDRWLGGKACRFSRCKALLLHIIEGLTQPEAAKRLGVSRRTLQRYIETALAKMALALAEPDT